MSNHREKEKSAGFIIFRRDEDGIRYLFLKVDDRLDFPKGLMEEGEDELSAALRELREESGISRVRVIPGFRKVLNYYYRRSGGVLVSKKLVVFLGEALESKVSVSWEHTGFEWLSLEDALRRIKYPSYREALREADDYMSRLMSGLGKWISGGSEGGE
ncbi:MAG: bis(5'-nucleosyl)-tetraphosphatase [Thermoproteota archaeon]